MDTSIEDSLDGTPETMSSRKNESPHVIGILWDRSGATRMHRSDGKVVDYEVPWPDEGSYLDRTVLDLVTPQIFFHTIFGDWARAELPTQERPAPIDGRPVVYLDQKDWSTLEKAHRDPARVRDDTEREAARRLVELALAKKILLPLSHGHFSETGKWADVRARYRHSLTMLRLSGGWQMRDPRAVRRHELSTAIRREVLAAEFPEEIPAVFTLEPWAISERPGPYPFSNLPPDYEQLFQSVLHMNVYFALALNPDATPVGSVDGWVEKQQRQTRLLHEELRQKDQRRKIALAFALDDASLEMAEAAAMTGVSSAAFKDWLERSWTTDFSELPAFAFFRELFVGKHLNATTRWEANDLTDMWYLATAAAYADYVVAERSTTSLLREAAKRLKVEKNLYRSLSNLLEHLERDPRVKDGA